MRALVDVSADHDVGGFAGYLGSSARIATSWCSVGIESGGGWTGAFVGMNNGNSLVTSSYYDASRNDDYMKAQVDARQRGGVLYPVAVKRNCHVPHGCPHVGATGLYRLV